MRPFAIAGMQLELPAGGDNVPLMSQKLDQMLALITKPRPDEEMVGLVYSLTPKLRESLGAWYLRPATLAIVVGVACVILNFIFY
jgi:hypothetical protein